MPPSPIAEQLTIPVEYGTPSRLLSWDRVAARLTDAHHYWLATVRPDGRPHVVPLDGLWIDDVWYFGGRPTTVKHRNLLSNPNAALHLEDGEAAVIVEGTCAIVTPPEEMAERLAATSKQKYGDGPPASVYLTGVWALTPVRVLAWGDLTVDATRFRFDRRNQEVFDDGGGGA